MNSRSVNETKNRAEVLVALFPKYLDTNFSASLDRFRLENNTYGGWLLTYNQEDESLYYSPDITEALARLDTIRHELVATQVQRVELQKMLDGLIKSSKPNHSLD